MHLTKFENVTQLLARHDLSGSPATGGSGGFGRRISICVQNAPAPAARWLERFQTAIQTLEHNPERCPLAPENARSSRILRQYLFGKRPHVFRAIYTIEGDTDWVLRIRRAQRRTLSADDLGEYGP